MVFIMAKNRDITIEITPIIFACLATLIGLTVIIFSSKLSDTAMISGFGLAGGLASGGAGIAPTSSSSRSKTDKEEREKDEE